MFNIKILQNILRPCTLKGNSSNINIDGIVTDTRKDCTGKMFVALEGDNFNGHDFIKQAINNGCIAICVKNEVAAKYSNCELPVLGVKDTLKAYQLMAAYHRSKQNCTVIGITGSSGKTSTKEIVYFILAEKYGKDCVLRTEGNTNNHIGVPLNLFKLNKKHKFAVIEMGTNHFGEIEVLADIAKPDIAIISSIGHAHIEAFKNLDGVATEKTDIFKTTTDYFGKTRTPVALIPSSLKNNKIFKQKLSKNKVLTFGQNNDADLQFKYIGGNFSGSKMSFFDKLNNQQSNTIQWHLHGAHQASNASAAVLLALQYEIDFEIIENALRITTLPGMRMKIFKHKNIIYINDAYNANIESVKATLQWLNEAAENENFPQKKIILILGDILETGTNNYLIHKSILEFALDLFPESLILSVGNSMFEICKNFDYTNIKSFLNSSDAANFLNSFIENKNYLVFLKASRGISLERCCPNV